ncbi:hypothetical protein AJ78_00911 [Emergomyces pasteurianus Ep9510]|uniref:Zn(2)-C6 fungal-type domain-containing protein n=1 Tax=Emergomyces pasteurianus Ep9510 TaxID=1447872 RepID=A0A1J9QV26_9EURO|nr:hypothetical protein AJ78_00911 [Emergomyces pasteurianus Ep9510]
MDKMLLQPRRSRTKTGCLCCRLRRKKCDEEQPACRNCQKRGLVCSWLGSKEFAWRLKMKQGSGRCSIISSLPTRRALEWNMTPLSPNMPSPISFPDTPLLLQFFIQETAPRLTCKGNCSQFQNPFQDEVPLLAESDSVVMHAVLALAGMHMGYYTQDQAREKTAVRHYILAMKELHSAITDWVAGSQGEVVRLLLITVLLVYYEAISGNKSGAMVYHLRACRQFAFHLTASNELPLKGEVVGLLLETYAYLELCSCLRFSPLEEDIRTNLNSFVSQLDYLRQFKTFGVLFGSASALYETIPSISFLSLLRQKELREHQDLGSAALYRDLDKLITSWSNHAISCVNLEFGPEGGFEIPAIMAVSYALQIFLETSFYYGSVSIVDFSKKVEPLVEATLPLLQLLKETPLFYTAYWPTVVLGANARTAAQRNIISSLLQDHTMPMTSRMKEILSWIWDHPDETVFGLPGLELVVKEQRTAFCFA